jgi:hypothetical protein
MMMPLSVILYACVSWSDVSIHLVIQEWLLEFLENFFGDCVIETWCKWYFLIFFYQ